MSNDRSKASSKTILPHSAIYNCLLQLTVSSPVLKVIQYLLTPSSLSPCHFVEDEEEGVRSYWMIRGYTV